MIAADANLEGLVGLSYGLEPVQVSDLEPEFRGPLLSGNSAVVVNPNNNTVGIH